MKKSFFDKEVIVKRGSKANSFLVILKGKALVLNSLGNEVFGVIQENQSFGLIEILKNVKWKNTIVSEKKSEILFVPRDKLIKNIFSNKLLTNLTLNILKMAFGPSSPNIYISERFGYPKYSISYEISKAP